MRIGVWTLTTGVLLLALTACGGDGHSGHDHGGHGSRRGGEPVETTTTPAEAPAGLPAEVRPYPLDTCLVMGTQLNAMGGAQRLVHDGQEWKFCCRSCVEAFKADPERWRAKLGEAVANGETDEGE